MTLQEGSAPQLWVRKTINEVSISYIYVRLKESFNEGSEENFGTSYEIAKYTHFLYVIQTGD